MKVDSTSLDDIIFPEVVKVSEETGSAQTVIPATLLVERGALGILYTLKLVLTMILFIHVCLNFQRGVLQQSTFCSLTWRIFFRKPTLKCTVLSHVLLSLIVYAYTGTRPDRYHRLFLVKSSPM